VTMRQVVNLPPEAGAAFLPSEADVQAYERNGWFVTPPIVPHDLLDSVRAAIEVYHTGHRDRPLPGDGNRARFGDWRPGDGDGVRNNEFASLQSDGVRDLVHFPLIGEIAARLSRSTATRLWADSVIYKPPAPETKDMATSAVGWHTDHSYWSTCTSNSMLTVWVPLHDTSAANGTLCVVDGSHLWPESEHLRGFKETNLDLATIGERIGRPIPPEIVRPIELKKGQVSIHHMRSLHASTPNRATYPRFAVAIHLQDGENRYRPFFTVEGVQVVLPHDRMARSGADGMPDYTDPAPFPQLWPQTAHG
jgi:hypothetical protein